MNPFDDAALLATMPAVVLALLVIHSGRHRMWAPSRRTRRIDPSSDSLRDRRRQGRWHRWIRLWGRRRLERRAVSAAAVAAWCDALSRSLRAGTALRTALATTVPGDSTLAHRTERLRRSIERGATVEAAVGTLEADPAGRHEQHSSHLGLAAAVLATSGAIGGPAAASLDRLAAALRLRVADGQERAAHSAQARLSAHVLTVVPLGLLGLLAATDADVRNVLRSGLGLTLLGTGLVLNAAGWWWMRRIIENRP